MKCCPTCNRPFPPPIFVNGKRRQALIDYVIAHPEGATTTQIIDSVWADDADGGVHAGTVHVMVRQINALLRERGEKKRIRASGGMGSVYRLVEPNDRRYEVYACK